MGEAFLAPPYHCIIACQKKSKVEVDEDFAGAGFTFQVNPQWGTGDDPFKAVWFTRGQKFHVNSLIINGDKSNPRD